MLPTIILTFQTSASAIVSQVQENNRFSLILGEHRDFFIKLEKIEKT